MDDNTIEFEIRSVDDAERTVSGVALPYGETVNVGGYKERFERGAFSDTEIGSPLYFNHDHRTLGTPIGSIIEARDTEAGLEIKARISKTPKGEEVYTLLRDGVLKKFSAGFEPVSHRTDSDGTVIRTKAKLVEVSIVPRPAYTNAAVSEVRSDADNNTLKENVMTETVIDSEVVELREQVSDLERKFAVLSDGASNTAPTTQFRSGGEFLKALAAGDEAAKTEIRAYTGATLSDADGATRPSWAARALKLVDENRQVLNLFTKQPLPPTGMTVEYPFVSGTSGTVGEQAAEGDDLPYMEVALDTATAPVKTYGGYSSLSRQAIERSDMAYLETVLRYQTLQYAKATEKAVRDAFTGATGFNTGTLAADDAESWIDLVSDSAALIEDNSKGARAEFALVSRDVFKRIAHMTDGNGRPLFVVNGDGQNSLGSVNLRGASANIAGIPVVVGPNMPANSLYVASSEAVTVYENPGAPTRLQDENIINLTKDFSLYGYLAVAVTNPLAVVKVDADLV